MNNFSKTVDLLHRALDVSTLRYQVTANNLANAEVPNFKRSTVNFESELKRAMDSEKQLPAKIRLTQTDSRHIDINPVYDYKTVQPRRVVDYATTAKANGNNVDAETEAMEVLKIQMNYQLLTMLENAQFSQMKIVLK